MNQLFSYFSHFFSSIFISLRARLLVTATSLLIFFLACVAFVIDSAYQAGLETQVKARLQSYIFNLLTEAEEEEEGEIVLPDGLTEPRFNQLSSGLYAYVLQGGNKALSRSGQNNQNIIPLWQSRSGLTFDWMEFEFLRQNQRKFEVKYKPTLGSQKKGSYFQYAQGIVWQTFSGENIFLTFTLVEDRHDYLLQLRKFRITLFVGLSFVTIFLFFAQWLMLRWGLAPVRQMEFDLEKIESGDNKLLPNNYPSELLGITQKLNLLLDNERQQIEKYKNTMADLAHSLKTPLTIIQGWIDDPDQQVSLKESSKQTLTNQLTRMDQSVQYHLQRAIASGNHGSATGIEVAQLVSPILGALQKVYADKDIQVENHISPSAVFWGIEGDLMELLGNLLENAFKYTRDRVAVGASGGQKDANVGIFQPCEFWVEDNGSGIPETQRQLILKRGARLDTQIAGQGIGLAVVKDILDSYKGEVSIETSRWGGARFLIVLPAFKSVV